MTNEDFNLAVDRAFNRTKKVLASKGKEYTYGKDRLSQFKKAGAVNSEWPTESLWGMGIKPITSIAEMVKTPDQYSTKEWLEKVTDARNYLFLLEALLIDLEVIDE